MRAPQFMLVLTGTLLLSRPALQAEDAPLLAPAPDVTVMYQLTGASQQNGAVKMQVTYAEKGRVRMDFFRTPEANVSFASLIYDPPSDRVITVLPERRGYLQRDVGGLPSPGSFLNARMNFTHEGTATIAGIECTDWRVLNGTAGEGTACVTKDGVVLRATRNKPVAGAAEAVTVKYGPPPPHAFDIPADYEHIPSAPPDRGQSSKP
jgi:hypothetical protein